MVVKHQKPHRGTPLNAGWHCARTMINAVILFARDDFIRGAHDVLDCALLLRGEGDEGRMVGPWKAWVYTQALHVGPCQAML